MGGELRQTSPGLACCLSCCLSIAAIGLALAACGPAYQREGGDERAEGERIIERAGCGSCHVIPGVPLSIGVVGPSLAHIGQRTVLAGNLSNTPAHLALWVQAPQQVLPHNAMPSSGLTAAQARDVAAFLETLR